MLPARWPVPLILIITVTACGSLASNWDPLAEEPPRPELPGDVDPNDAYDLYRYGESLLERAPDRAADAFYWASRLDPTWADPIYARRVAHFMSRPGLFLDYMYRRRNVMRSPGVAKLDSLYIRALRLNPFLHRKHDVRAIRYALVREIERSIRQESPTASVDESAIRHYLDNQLNRSDRRVRAWLAESEGRFPAALELYTGATDGDPDDAGLFIDLARVQFRLGMFDAARETFATAIGMLREEDEDELVRIYDSKVLLEHSIGMILEQQDDPAGAREAYARALQEDLSYAPAHVRLAELALAAGDTATALGEFALAAEIDPANAGVGYQHGNLLARAGELDRAAAALRRAIELEPYFAAPYLALARLLDDQGRAAEAAEQYRAYLEHASRTSRDRSAVERRLRELAAGGAAGAAVR